MTDLFKHHRIVTDGVALHYVSIGAGKPVILLHGFPQTWFEWRPLIALLGEGYRIVAPDLRGIGASPGPVGGDDKVTMASDVHAIAEAEFGDTPAVVVGHDLGGYVAFAYALRFRAAVKALIIADAPLPGTSLFEAIKGNPRVWHIAFHGARDFAEMLIAGRERAYVRQFIHARIVDTGAVPEDDIDVYDHAYAAPGAMRAALEIVPHIRPG